MTTEIQHVGSCTGGNTVPIDEDGRPYHFGCKMGEVANYVLVVSDYGLAGEIAKNFEGTPFRRESNRGYITYTGTFKGHRLSIVAIGIGFAMVDFLIRELRAVTRGPLTFIFLGTAPTPSDSIALGTAVVARDAVAYELDFENFDKECPYKFFKKPVEAAKPVVDAIVSGLESAGIPHALGRIASNPSFCAGVCAPTKASGGVGPFDFKTEGLMEKLESECGKIDSLEMDAYLLLWTSLRAIEKNISSAVVSVIGSNLKGDVLENEKVKEAMLKVAPVLLEKLGELERE